MPKTPEICLQMPDPGKEKVTESFEPIFNQSKLKYDFLATSGPCMENIPRWLGINPTYPVGDSYVS